MFGEFIFDTIKIFDAASPANFKSTAWLDSRWIALWKLSAFSLSKVMQTEEMYIFRGSISSFVKGIVFADPWVIGLLSSSIDAICHAFEKKMNRFD